MLCSVPLGFSMRCFSPRLVSFLARLGYTSRMECHNRPTRVDSRTLYYITFYGCNLLIFVISQNVCPWQAFPAQSKCLRVRPEPTRVKHLLRKSVNYGRKKFYSTGHTRMEVTDLKKSTSINCARKKFYNTGLLSMLGDFFLRR